MALEIKGIRHYDETGQQVPFLFYTSRRLHLAQLPNVTSHTSIFIKEGRAISFIHSKISRKANTGNCRSHYASDKGLGLPDISSE